MNTTLLKRRLDRNKKMIGNEESNQVETQQQEDGAGSGGWGTWWSSTIGNVVRTMNHQTNQLGQQLQKLVAEDEEDGSEHIASSEENISSTPENTSNTEEEDGSLNDNGGKIEGNIIEETEKQIETSLKSAEQKIKSFFSTFYQETSQLVDETQEFKYVKTLASTFGQTVMNTLEEASRILYDTEEVCYD